MTAPGGIFSGLQKKPVNTLAPIQGPAGPGALPPGISGTGFGPNQNLISTQINPSNAADVNAARGQLDTQLGALQGPDRQALAQQTFGALTSETDPAYVDALRKVNEAAAAGGRVGSGVTTSELGDVALGRQKYLGNLAKELSADAAGQSLNDRLAALSGTEGGLGTLAGLDYSGRQELRGERGYESDQSQQAFQNALEAAGLTGPSGAALGIGGQYGQQAGDYYQGAGGILQQILARQQQAPRPMTSLG